MWRVRSLFCLALVVLWAWPASAQDYIRLNPTSISDTLSANGDSVTLTNANVGGFGSVKIQTIDSYSGTWEVRCTLAGVVVDRSTITSASYDADAELKLTAWDGSSTVTSVTDAVGGWDVQNAAGCRAITVIATAGFAASDTVVVISATQSGGGSSGGSASGGLTDAELRATPVPVSATNLDVQSGGVDLATAATQSDIDVSTNAIEAIVGTGGQFDLAINSNRVDVNIATIDGNQPTADLTFDMELGAGTQTRSAIGLAVAASGGAVQITGDTANGLDVDVTRLPALVAGTASIGEVTGVNDLPIVACNNVGVIDTAASGNTQLVALSGSTVIYVCSYTITAEATVDVRLVRGTGSACATGETSISGTYALSTTTGLLGISRGSGLGMITKGTAGDAFCIELGGAVQVNGEYTYAQF